MIDKLQCQTHTRTPWGSSPHRYDPRIRYLVMGLLCISVLAVFVVSLVFIGHSAAGNYSSDSSDDGDATISTDMPSSTELPSSTDVSSSTEQPSSTTTISATKLNHTSIGFTPATNPHTLLQTTITVPFDESYTSDIG
ncbi:hypothetical protein J3F83DRAFT_227037 [Trichoderma novae-zelandiae]